MPFPLNNLCSREDVNNMNQKSIFSQKEEEVLDFWEKNKVFEKSLEKKAPHGDYVFYDGPPFATGLPHYGHLVASIMKDTIPRYFTMKGYRVKRRWGWDCHGLPVENLAEKELGLKNKQDIEDLGVGKFNNYCESIVLRYAEDWKKTIKRVGRWVDMENDYKTMNPEYTESIWWVFKSLFEKGLIYKGYKSMHICGRCGTTLSNFEVGQGYKDIKDFSVVVSFELLDEPKTYILAWTTTPWTLIGNVALAVKEDIDYVVVSIDGKKYILAKKRAEELLKDKDYKIEKEVKGRDLVGKKYKPLFDYYVNNEIEGKENGWKVYGGDFVSIEEGTGVVHIAPAFGEDDMQMKEKYDLPFIQHVDMFGKFKEEVKDFLKMEVKPKDDHTKTDVEIIKYLAKEELLFKKEKYEHSYPHCWRCETPLLNYATDSWFVKVTDIKEDLVKNNQKVRWVPEHVKEGRFGKWLDQARDWAISRNRYWGAPLPVWECQECGKVKVIGSIKELENVSGEKISDLHKQFVDKIILKCECEGEMKRVPEVLDCWFESGSMPYAQMNYTGKPLDDFDPQKGKNFPAQFIAEGMDQTRGWFYTLMVLSTALFNKEAFENVIVNGIILAEDGQKMSKSKANYPDPSFLFDKFCADAVRHYLLSSPVLIGENLNFREEGVKEVLRKNVILLLNILNFYNQFKEDFIINGEKEVRGESVLDKWIISRLHQTIKGVTENLDSYKIPPACDMITLFIDEFSTWYLRRSRERFKEDSRGAVETTGYVLYQISKVIAPIMPFLAESIYQQVTGSEFKNGEESVHLVSYPEFDEKMIDEKVLDEMEKTRNVVSTALKERADAKIKVRQPLSSLTIGEKIEEDFLYLVKDEVNVKRVVFDESLNGTVILDTKITEELKKEGDIREVIRSLQSMRKEAGLVPDDKINLFYNGCNLLDLLSKEIDSFKDETGVVKIEKGEGSDSLAKKVIKVDGEDVSLSISLA
jgi:isoleucyl-tRNA synthetase